MPLSGVNAAAGPPDPGAGPGRGGPAPVGVSSRLPMRLSLLAALLFFSLGPWTPGCGPTAAEQRPEPTPREDDELSARDWHDRAVRLESEARIANEHGDPCPDTCALAARTCELARQICALADGDAHDEGTRMLCDDVTPRCEHAAATTEARCGCAGGG